MLQLHVTALFYLDNSRKIHPQGVRACQPKDAKRRVPQRAGERGTLSPWLLFLYVFFFLPLGLPYVNWASQECCLFYPRSSLWSSDLPLFYFPGLSLSLSFSHHQSGLVSYSNYLTKLSFRVLTADTNKHCIHVLNSSVFG